MGRKRRFGRVRQLASGRWQARYKGPDGVDRAADNTFPTKTDADVWLTRKEAEILDGGWLDPDAGKVPFGPYARAWVDERPALRPKTYQLYEGLVRLHLAPTFEATAIAEIKEARVRRWRKALLDDGVGEVTVAKAYRLLKSIMNTAVDDGLIRRNPCRIKGAGKETSPERPVLTMAQVFAVAGAIPQRYRLLVLLATFGSLRWGELAALRRSDIDLDAGLIRVERQTVELKTGELVTGPPKSDAGKRTVAVPGLLVDELRAHLKEYAGAGDDGLVFVGPKGAPLRRPNFSRIWAKALDDAGVPRIHFHDLRHTGNTFAATTGATLRELMDRMGHASTRAAVIYQHATAERGRAIADALGDMAEAVLTPKKKRKPAPRRASGTRRARKTD